MPHLVDIHVGKRLRLRRVMLGLSQEATGKAIGVTFQQVQKYERGTNRMGSSRLYDFARFLSVPVSYFFEGLEAIQPVSDNEVQKPADLIESKKMASRETLEMIRAYYRIAEPDVRNRFLDLVKALADNSSPIANDRNMTRL